MKSTLDTISDTFAGAPHASVSSNEPYVVGVKLATILTDNEQSE